VKEMSDGQDNIPLADPAELFESIEYKQSGSVFWADLNKDHRMFPSPAIDQSYSVETGIGLMNSR